MGELHEEFSYFYLPFGATRDAYPPIETPSNSLCTKEAHPPN
jgi:hypothetical protein